MKVMRGVGMGMGMGMWLWGEACEWGENVYGYALGA